MGEQDSTQTTAVQRPANDNMEAWEVYWKARGQPWRTEPETDAERQEYLAKRRNIIPVIEKGIYPFRDVKLSRADVEWLLATHENERGPVDWNDEKQRNRTGLDVRGADMRQVNLSRLPLACLSGGEYTRDEWLLEKPSSVKSGAKPGTSSWLSEVKKKLTALADSVSSDLPLLASPDLTEEAKYVLHDFAGVKLEKANLFEAHLEGANLINAHLEQANLDRAHLEAADLRLIHLEEAQLRGAHLEGANFYRAHLEAARLGGSFLSASTRLREIILGNKQHGFIFLASVHWDNVDLSVVNWKQMRALGDEYQAHESKKKNEERKDTKTRLGEYEKAVRANRQLAVALQGQGLNEDAARFAYRAQRLQQIVLRKQRKFGRYLFSGFLDVLAGYGFRPLRSVFWYLFIILGFAVSYYAFGHVTPLEAFILSLTSFHGRGFFPGTNITLSDPRVVLAAFEAVIGLFIEISFIATFTKRFLGS